MFEKIGWGGRIRTSEWRNQNPLPYLLATPQPVWEVTGKAPPRQPEGVSARRDVRRYLQLSFRISPHFDVHDTKIVVGLGGRGKAEASIKSDEVELSGEHNLL